MPESGNSKVIDVLLVEDDEGDVLVTKEAFDAVRQIDNFFLTPVCLPG